MPHLFPGSFVALSVLGVLGASAVAQTFVVDANNGPGTNFLDIPPAIAAVPNGSVLLVRSGTYGPIAMSGRSLSVLAEPGAVVTSTGPIDIANVGALQSVVVRGVRVPSGGLASAQATNCQGLVMFDRVDQIAAPGVFTAFGIHLQGCDQAVVRQCSARGMAALAVEQSQATVERCLLQGEDLTNAGGGSGIAAQNSALTIARCFVRGGNGGFVATPLGIVVAHPGAAVWLNTSTASFCDDGSGGYVAGASPLAPHAVVDGYNSQVMFDNNTVLVPSGGALPFSPNVAAAWISCASVATQPAPPGGTVQTSVLSPAGSFVCLLFGRPAAPMAVPGIWPGRLWLDPAATVVVAGFMSVGMIANFSLAVPATPALIGERYGWQAVLLQASGGLRFGNASIYAH
ncbi:MAG TPA: hypothetical protein VFD82_07270 [Planctomycetota bacterium]|nr:hypothetical protein [Planctomycetota bacterium]